MEAIRRKRFYFCYAFRRWKWNLCFCYYRR